MVHHRFEAGLRTSKESLLFSITTFTSIFRQFMFPLQSSPIPATNAGRMPGAFHTGKSRAEMKEKGGDDPHRPL